MICVPNFGLFVKNLHYLQSYCFLHNAHRPTDAASNSVPANKQTRARRIRLSVGIPDEPEGEVVVGGKGAGKASPSVSTGWVVTVDMGVLVG